MTAGAPGHVVIVGAGQGGCQAAMSLREEGYAGSITLIGAEDGLPYQRPPLSKDFLRTGATEGVILRPESFFARKQITLRAGLRVDAIDPVAQVLRAGDEVLPYDRLVLATGTRPAIPPVAGIERAMGLRSLADAREWRAALVRPRRVAVIGGGFIGLEFAAVARSLGHQVDVVEAAPRLLQRVVSAPMAAQFHQMHAGLGTRIHLGAPVVAVTPDGIVLASGQEIGADLVLLAAGVRPNVELAAAAGLEVADGIVVNRSLQTADPLIHALGDCCAFPAARGGGRIRLESVQAATDHARCIARAITSGLAQPYAAVPWFWSDQAGWKLQIAGLAGPDDLSVAVGDHVVLRFGAAGLTAVETINDAKTHMRARRVLAQAVVPDQKALAAKGYDLSAL
jgi:3-phenylpropionate/trans-cinnamate dioxygenase ferredoxin reductase component